MDPASLPDPLRRDLLRYLGATSVERAKLIGELTRGNPDMAELLIDLEADDDLRSQFEVALIQLSQPSEAGSSAAIDGDNVLRVGVKDEQQGVWSSVWRIWTHGGDVYVAYAPAAIKFSLHRSGRWRFAYTDDEKARAAGRVPGDDRAVAKWLQPHPRLPGLIHALAIRIPTNDLRSIDMGQDKPNVVWLPPAPKDWAVYLNVFVSDALDPDDWPGRRSMASQLLARLPLSAGRQVEVTKHEEPLRQEEADWLTGEKDGATLRRWDILADAQGESLRGHVLQGVDDAPVSPPMITDVAFDIPNIPPRPDSD
jgi:hypothetical protein